MNCPKGYDDSFQHDLLQCQIPCIPLTFHRKGNGEQKNTLDFAVFMKIVTNCSWSISPLHPSLLRLPSSPFLQNARTNKRYTDSEVGELAHKMEEFIQEMGDFYLDLAKLIVLAMTL